MIVTDISILRAPNEDVLPEEIEFLKKKLIEELAQSKIGMGLAAPQIGINKRIAVITNEEENLCLVNPIIIETKGMLIHKGEGCLSFPEMIFNTYRFKEIHLIDDLHPGGMVVTGLASIIIEHECDHLNGVLIIDKVANTNKIGRNDMCPCGRGVKFKKCHGMETPLSDEAQKARKPPPPDWFVDALQDSIHVEKGKLISSKPIKIIK